MDLLLKDKTYLVMAASRGLGRAVAQALRAEGAQIITTSREPGESLRLDTKDEASRERFLVEMQGQRLDGIFVNTGGPKGGGVLELANRDWEEAFQQIVLGPIHIVRELVPAINPGGSVLFNASSSIAQPIPHLALSNVLRAGLHALVKTLVDELAPKGLRVNLIVPGRIDTDRLQVLDQAQASRSGISAVAMRSQSESRIPLGRYGDPNEFGQLAAFLLSPGAAYVNGSTYWIDGGLNRGL